MENVNNTYPTAKGEDPYGPSRKKKRGSPKLPPRDIRNRPAAIGAAAPAGAGSREFNAGLVGTAAV